MSIYSAFKSSQEFVDNRLRNHLNVTIFIVAISPNLSHVN